MLRISVARKLRDFTLEVEIVAQEGEIPVLMGNNGSGKTTVLNLVAGLLSPDSGTIEACGKTLFSAESGIDVPPEQRNIGYIFQNYALFPHMTVFDNVAFGLRERKVDRAEIDRRVRDELEIMGMWDLRNVKSPKLSGGQRQKVALARSMVIRPSLMLLDEPMSALDAGMHATMRKVIRSRLKKERVQAIMVLHNLRDAAEMGDRVCLLDWGKIVLEGKPGDVFISGRNPFIDNLLS